MDRREVSLQTIQRLPLYLSYLKSLPEKQVNVSATVIAAALGLNDVQVRKDLAMISGGGRPKVGYITESLILDIEQFLGYNDVDKAVIVGAGNLARALMSYSGFKEYGLDIVAAFDVKADVIGTEVNGKPVLSTKEMKDFCTSRSIKIGIITVPTAAAQTACDALIESGVLAIWNFAPAHLNVPEHVLVQHENMACSLALLSKHLSRRLEDG